MFHHKKHPSDMGAPEVTSFLESLVEERSVSASTQNQALSALIFLYREVLDRPLPRIEALPRARLPGRLPVVLSRAEVSCVLSYLDGTIG